MRIIPKINGYNWGIVIFIALGTWSTAYGLSAISGIVGQPAFYEFMDIPFSPSDPDYQKTTNFFSETNGLLMAGAVAGILINAYTADKFGRLRCLQGGAIIFLLGGGLQSGGANFNTFMAGRFINGMGIGSMVTTIPMFQAELSTPATRGFMVCMTGVMFAIGYTSQGWIAFACYYTADKSSSFAWRFPLVFMQAPAFIMLLGSPFLPESPRWLVQEGHNEKALRALIKIHHEKDDPNDTYARREYIQMRKQVEYDMELVKRQGFMPLFRTKANLKRAALAFGTMWFAQFVGVFLLASYNPLIYASLGFGGSIPLLLNAVWTTITIPGNFSTAFFIDRFGRRNYFIVGISGCLFCLIFLCALEAQYLGGTNEAGLNASVFFTFFFIAFWCTCLDATIYVYIAEIFPSHLRSHGQSFGTLGFYLAAFVCLVAAPVALNVITWKFYLILICLSALWLVLVIFFWPETKQRSIDDLNALFGEKVVVHFYGATEAEMAEYEREIEMELGIERPKNETSVATGTPAGNGNSDSSELNGNSDTSGAPKHEISQTEKV